ncbi:uncharacterized protein LOC124172069 [Ischnura elegans]|uniref:uncharacterized protein LOC124172069 n=1 Tax=Ischnura elegans TaxID=197161 RepID=UPI001ED88423|nr:uncharacterized protein LOC124172069 [Ischnura elegans]
MSRTTSILTDSSENKSESDLCRLCRKNNYYFYNIFTSNVSCEITVKDALHDLIGLQVAVGDGLPTTLCPPCLEKLTEFSVFKKICLESNTVLRSISPRNYCRSIQGEEAADEELGTPAETKDCVEDDIQGYSHLNCSLETTEIYIPVPDSHQPRANMLVTVKDENKDPLSEGNYPVMNTVDPAGIPSVALHPLATDDLSIQGDQVADDELGSSADTKDFIQDEIQGTSHLTHSVQRTEIYIPVPEFQQSRANMLSIPGDEVADDELGSSADTKDFIQDEIQGSSHLTCPVQTTEIYIPVPDTYQSRANMLVSVKGENEDPLSEGNYPEMYTPDPDGISINALDSLATDDLAQASKSSQGEVVDAEGTGAIVTDLDSMQVLTKKELSLKETDATEPTFTENGELVQNQTMAMESMTEAMESPGPERASALFAVLEPKTRASNSRKGKKLMDKDVKQCDTLPADKITSCSIPNDGRLHSKSRCVSQIRGNRATMTIAGKRGGCDNTETIKIIRSTENEKNGPEAAIRENKGKKHPCQAPSDTYEGENFFLR